MNLETVSSVVPDPTTITEEKPCAGIPAQQELDRSLVTSLAWRAAADWSSQIVSWLSLFIVVRLLSPADFGIVGMAVILLPYLKYVGEFGIPRAIVTLRELTEEQLRQLNTVAVLMGVGLFGVAALLSKPIALFFRTPQLAPVVVVSCLALIPFGVRAVAEGLLAKEMRFAELSWVKAISTIATALTTLSMAAFGFGYWALVIGNLAGLGVRCVLLVRACPHGFAVPQSTTVREPMRFGWHVLISTVALNSYQRLDNLTAGRALGQAALGLYAMAWNLANVPLEKIASLVTYVVPSYLAAVQNDLAAMRRYTRTLTEALALATFPATVGLGLVARELVPLALGHKWEPLIAPLEILSAYAAFRSMPAFLAKVLTAVGDARYVMWNDLAALGLMPIAFFIGSHWGIAGIAWGWVAAYPLVAIPLYLKTVRAIKMETREYVRALQPALSGTVVMVIAVGTVKYVWAGAHPLIVRLLLEIASGVISYSATVLLLHSDRAVLYIRMVKSLRQGRQDSSLLPGSE
jgi:teichuronic acid exporter